jgi:hypothetical protein
MVKKGLSCAELQRRKGGPVKSKGGAKRPRGDMRQELDKMSVPPTWQTFSPGAGLISLVNMTLKAGTASREVSIIDGSNQPPPTASPTRVTVVVVAPISLRRWKPFFGIRTVFFLMVDDPKEEDPTIGDVLRLLCNVHVHVQTGDTKKGEITLGAGVAAKNGCGVVFFSKARNSPKKTNETVQLFHKQLQEDVRRNGGGSLEFFGDCAITPTGAKSL